MAQVNIPPIVNDQGNINVHIREGASIPIIIQDDEGNEVDSSTIPLFFICGSFRKALEANPNDANGRLLHITDDDLLTIVHGSNFVVSDETDIDQPILRWEGKIYKRG